MHLVLRWLKYLWLVIYMKFIRTIFSQECEVKTLFKKVLVIFEN